MLNINVICVLDLTGGMEAMETWKTKVSSAEMSLKAFALEGGRKLKIIYFSKKEKDVEGHS